MMKNKLVKSQLCGEAARSSEVAASPKRKNVIFSFCKDRIFNSESRYFIYGAGTVFDLSGSYLNTPDMEAFEVQLQDADAIRNDFSVIASDFRNILNAQLKIIS